MKINAIISTLQQLKPELEQRFGVSSIGLFGSVVREAFSQGKSDIDINVDFSKPIGVEFIDFANFLESVFRCKVDLISKRSIKQKYFQSIEKDVMYV